MSGPPPKRDAERHGHHTPAGGKSATKVDIAKLFDDAPVSTVRSIPDTDHPTWELPPSDPSEHVKPTGDAAAPWEPSEDWEEDGSSDVLDHHRAPRIPLQFDPPPPNPSWEPAAREWYLSLHESGQAIFYEPSDWATAWIMAESISRDLAPQFVGISETTGKVVRERLPLKGASLGAYLKGFTQLMATEGERRRLRIELERHKINLPDSDNVVDINSMREGLV